MKRILGLAGAILLGINLSSQTYNYAEALQKTIYFYDANKCGNQVEGGRLLYRGNCHVADEFLPLGTEMTNFSESFIAANRSILDPDGNGYMDVAGGFHDAGDHVQFGLPQTYSTSTIEWAFYEFRDAFVNIGEEEHMKEILRWGSDYYLKCTYRDASGAVVAFCYQVGEGGIDHNEWSPPELIDTDKLPRPAHFATTEEPASDQCAGAAASLALSYLNNLNDDPAYAAECLDVAVALYDFAVANRGLGYDGGFYNSSFDEDEMAWAAVWLNIATGEERYLTDIISRDADGFYTGWLAKIIRSNEDDWQNIWVHSWDTKWGGVFAKLAPITNDPFHWWIFRWNLEYWSGVAHENSGDGNYLKTTPDGFSFLAGWGSARYNAAAQFQGMVYKKYADDRFDTWMTDQMNYIMGDNPLGRSYIVGYSHDYARHPHHRAAHGSATNSMFDPVEHKHTLWGALVGGPDASDQHVDSTSDFIYNEVAIDYNAGAVGALAGHVYYFGEGMEPVSPFPTPDPPLVEYQLKAKLGDITSESSQITLQVMNESAFPPRKDVNIMVRYYFNISELYEYGQDVNDLSFAVHYDENAVNSEAVAALGPIEVNADLGIYYMEFQWPESGFYGWRDYQFAITAKQDATYVGRWDASNDYSNTGLTDVFQETDYIVLYADGVKISGTPPSGNSSPNAVATASPTSGLLPLEVAFDASQSTDADGDNLTYTWNFGDGTTATGISTTHTFTVQDNYNVVLTVSDGELTDEAILTISAGVVVVNDPPVADLTTDITSGNIPLTVHFDASSSSDPNSDALTYSWNFGDGTTGSGVTASHTYTTEGLFDASLTVSDYEFSDVASVQIQTTTAQPTCENAVAISLPYVFENAGEYCWITDGTIDHVNSWNLSLLEINGVDYTNTWSNSMPARINGNYYIHFVSSVEYGHVEIEGSGTPVDNYTLSVSAGSGGSVNTSGGVYPAGTVVTLTATPDGGYVFSGWSGDVISNQPTIDITLNSNVSVAASFTAVTPQEHVLATSLNGSGTITVSPDQATFTDGTLVTLTAAPDAGWHFVNWTGDASGTSIAVTLTMDSDKSVTANFLENLPSEYTLSVIVVGNGSVAPSNGIYNGGEVVALTATADADNHFVSWSGDASGTSTTVEVTMDTDKDIVATFEPDGDLPCENPVAITLPFSYNGAGEFCWEVCEEIAYVNSWNTSVVTINNVDITNLWLGTMPEPNNGCYYIHYVAPYPWSHFEATGTKSAPLELSDNLEVYPNPFTNQLNIEFNSELMVENVEVYDLMGKLIFKYEFSTKTNVLTLGKELSEGSYLLKINTDQGIQTTLVNKQ